VNIASAIFLAPARFFFPVAHTWDLFHLEEDAGDLVRGNSLDLRQHPCPHDANLHLIDVTNTGRFVTSGGHGLRLVAYFAGENAVAIVIGKVCADCFSIASNKGSAPSALHFHQLPLVGFLLLAAAGSAAAGFCSGSRQRSESLPVKHALVK